jgi:CelD/BcsL family acetyltransferase involved in cellulose biosynthesis
MPVEIVKREEEFFGLREQWNNLLSQSSVDTVFLTWDWLWSWWESYAEPADDLHIILIHNAAGKITGIVPLFLRKRHWLPFCPMKTLQFIGDGSWDSDYLDIILAGGREEEALSSLWEYLSRDHRTWDVIHLPPVPENSVTLRWLAKLNSSGEVLLRNEYVPCTAAELPDSWDEYVMSLSPRFRTKIRSTLRNLEKIHDLRFYSIENENDLAAALDKLFDLHTKRWELKKSDGVFLSPAKRRFYRSFAPQFLKQGWLAFDFLEIDGRVVACQLCFRYKRNQFLLQEGFDPEFGSESVGIALRAMVFRKAIEDGIKSYDFLAGIGRHKTQWGGREKACEKVSVAPRTLQNIVYIKTPIVIAAFKERVKAILPAKVLEMPWRPLAY